MTKWTSPKLKIKEKKILLRKPKDKPETGGKIFASHISDKGFVLNK